VLGELIEGARQRQSGTLGRLLAQTLNRTRGQHDPVG
jgi:hypothetical protein